MNTDMKQMMIEVESRFAVNKIKYKGMPLWPFLRSEIFNAYLYAGENVKDLGQIDRMSNSRFKRLVKAIKNTSVSLFLSRHKNIIFTSNLHFRAVGSNVINQLTAKLEFMLADYVPVVGFVNRQPYNCYQKCIDQMLIDMFSVGIAKLKRKKIRYVSGVQELIAVLDYLGIQYDWETRVCTYLELVYFYFIWFKFSRPKALYVECYYDTKLAAVYAARVLGIPTIEFQHGSLTEGHLAYHAKVVFEKIYPDYFLCFGKRYKENVSELIYPQKNIYVIGYYYLSLMKKRAEANKWLFDKKYGHVVNKVIVTVVGQHDLDLPLIEHCKKIARSYPDIFFIFGPRVMTDVYRGIDMDNFVVDDSLDIYQLMQNTDVSLGIISTGLIESLVFGKPSIMVDIKERASDYFGKFFDGIVSVKLTTTVEETRQAILELSKLSKDQVIADSREYYEDHHEEKLWQFLIGHGLVHDPDRY